MEGKVKGGKEGERGRREERQRERERERLPLLEREQEERKSGSETAGRKGVGMACLLKRQNNHYN